MASGHVNRIQKAEHMAAPTNAANVKKALANSEPSTHGITGPAKLARSCPLKAAKPSHRDDQGYSVVDSTDKERIVDGRRPGKARLLPQGSPHEAPPYVRARTALSQLSVNAWL